MQNDARTKQRASGEPWDSLSKIAGFRWYLSRIENLLFSIYAEHPDTSDPKGAIYHAIWRALGACERELIKAKDDYKPAMPAVPAVPKPGCEKGGCWDDNDCFDDWVCRDGFCRPPDEDSQ